MCVLWLRFVEVCIFFVCVFFLRSQVAAVYKDPSVGNLINIVIVKLIVIHNEQVGAVTVEGGWGGAQVPLMARTLAALSALHSHTWREQESWLEGSVCSASY